MEELYVIALLDLFDLICNRGFAYAETNARFGSSLERRPEKRGLAWSQSFILSHRTILN